MNKIIVLLSVIFFAVRLPGLGYDITNSDALRWHNRGEDFLQAVKSGDFNSTYQRYHPGVTLMWINAVVKQAGFTIQTFYTDNPKTLENAEWYPIIHGFSKGINTLFYFALVLFCVKMISLLFSTKVSRYFFFLLSVEPYFIGINRWLHLTSFEVLFSFSAFLAILYWFNTQNRKYFFVSAILIGLGILSKTTSGIAGLIIGPIIIYKSVKDKKYENIVIYPLIVMLTFFALFPAMWTNSQYVISKLANSFSGAVLENIRMQQLLWYIQPIYYLVIVLFKLSPIVLVLFIAHLKGIFKKSLNEKLVLAYLLVFFVTLSLSDQKIDRYSLALFPPIILLASIMLASLTTSAQKVIVGLSVLLLIYSTYNFYPQFSMYNSPFFGGINTMLNLRVYENSGEYYADAAFYLKQFGRDKKVYVPNNIDSFKPYYNGEIAQEIEPGINYEVMSLDIDRVTPKSEYCSILDKSFGPRFGPPLLFVYRCE